jgi:urea transporter
VAEAKTYSRANGVLALVAASGALVLVALEGYDGNSAMAGLFGFLGLSLVLQGLDDLVWQGRQERVLVPLKRVVVGLALVCALWVAVGWFS